MGPFLVSNDYSYILLAVDYVSRWVEAIATKTNDTKVVVDLLKSNIFCQFGVPKALISDQGSHFCNRAMSSLLHKYGVMHRIATAYHPQTNGQAEVLNTNCRQLGDHFTDGTSPARWRSLSQLSQSLSGWIDLSSSRVSVQESRPSQSTPSRPTDSMVQQPMTKQPNSPIRSGPIVSSTSGHVTLGEFATSETEKPKIVRGDRLDYQRTLVDPILNVLVNGDFFILPEVQKFKPYLEQQTSKLDNLGNSRKLRQRSTIYLFKAQPISTICSVKHPREVTTSTPTLIGLFLVYSDLDYRALVGGLLGLIILLSKPIFLGTFEHYQQAPALAFVSLHLGSLENPYDAHALVDTSLGSAPHYVIVYIVQPCIWMYRLLWTPRERKCRMQTRSQLGAELLSAETSPI
ncbi:Gag-Pol polyprotein, partial [Mucuna pruriens]